MASNNNQLSEATQKNLILHIGPSNDGYFHLFPKTKFSETIKYDCVPLSRPREAVNESINLGQINLQMKLDKQQQYEKKKLYERCIQQINNLEQKKLINNLRIYGVQETVRENTFTVVIKIFQSMLGLPIEVFDLVSCYRQDEGSSQIRPIIVEFYSHTTRNLVLSSRRLLKGTKIAICEDLTYERAKVYRKANNVFGKEKVWISVGIIKVRLPNNKVLCFRSLMELDEYVSKHNVLGI